MSFAKGLALVTSLEGGMILTSSLEQPPVPVFGGIRKDIYEKAGYAEWPPSPTTYANYYRAQFWDAVKCDSLPEPADSVLFQLAVHAGPQQAIKCLQCAVVARPIDGVFGPQTAKNVALVNMHDLPDLILVAQDAFYVFGASQQWRAGFLGRTDKVRAAIAEGAI